MNPSRNSKSLLSAVMLAILAPLALAIETAPENPVLELTELAGDSLNLRFAITSKLPLYVTRSAGRVLDVLSSQTLTVLAMDRYGLKVQGRGKHGLLTGWVGQKKAFPSNEKQLAKLRAFYTRQLEIAQCVAENRPAIGMSLAELKRILGKPTSHMVGSNEQGQTESLTWIIKQKVDLNKLLAVGTDDDILKMEVEVGRVEVTLAEGLASAISRIVDGGAAEIPTVVPPVKEPFGPPPERKLAEK